MDDLARDPSNPNNETRAQWAQEALMYFAEERNQDDQFWETRDGALEVVGDFLCDLMHLCDLALPVTFEELVERGRMHYEAERRGGRR